MRKRRKEVNFSKKWNDAELVRNYVCKIGMAHLRPDDYNVLVKKYEVITSFCKPRPGWQDIIGYEPDPEYFMEISFAQRGAFYRETLVRVLASFDDKETTIYESVQWYPDGDLKTSPGRTMRFQHVSSLPAPQVRPYFIAPQMLRQWISGGDAECVYHPDKHLMSISVLQSHYFDWHYNDISSHHIEMEQIWLNKYHSNISIQLDERTNGTEITVCIHGIISINLAEEYRYDWEDIRQIP